MAKRTVLPSTLGNTDAHYRRMGIHRDHIEPSEDGMRTDSSRGTYEWWYFDAHLDGGSKIVITFRNKNIADIDTPLAPGIDFNFVGPGIQPIDVHVPFQADQFSAAKDSCNVSIGANTFKGDLHTYQIHVELAGVTADISLTSTVPAWRPRTGCLFFGEREEHYFAWMPAVPQGNVVATIVQNGGAPQRYTGIGYHDHNWGNVSMLKLMHNWYWARGKLGDYSLIASYITAEARYGYQTFPVFMLAKGDCLIGDDAGKVRFSIDDVHTDPDTGKPVANQILYEYVDGPERYVLTFIRQSDILHLKFLDEIHGIKHVLARLIGFNGAYLRFTGDLKLDHYQDNQLVETLHDEAIWELMYFGRVPKTGT